ncbi:MAG TPA: hypothetical protein VK898_15750, partial [Chloroflexota bacterium]|nr:hypothetical protein [Chloroflexota bacterium]
CTSRQLGSLIPWTFTGSVGNLPGSLVVQEVLRWRPTVGLRAVSKDDIAALLPLRPGAALNLPAA